MKITTVLSLLLLDISLSSYTVQDDTHMSLDPAPFSWGVASGDPTPTSVILWTRVKIEKPIKVLISTDKSMETPDRLQQETEKEFHPSADNDYTVYMKIIGLLPDTTYYYRFEVNGKYSRIGRTKTAPKTNRDVVIGIVSCSSHWDGWYNSYKGLLSKNIDFIIHMGDVIYNSLPGKYEQLRVPNPLPSFIDPKNLTNWRKLHAFLRHDIDFRNLLASVPWIVQWDNHDVVYEGGEQAFFEWFPIQIPSKSHYSKNKNAYHIDRIIPYGPLIDVFVIDTHLGSQDGSDKLIGNRQMNNLNKLIPKSTARYRILTSTKTMSPWKVTRLPFNIFHENAEIKDIGKGVLHPKNWLKKKEDGSGNFHLWQSKDIYFDLGLWDGSPKEREKLLKILKLKGNNIVVSGDTHTALGADVINAKDVHEYEPCNKHAAAVEFAPPSVSRGNWDEGLITKLNLKPTSDVSWPVKYLRTAMAKANPHHAYLNLKEHGYGVLTVSKDKVIGNYFYVDKTKPMEEVKEINPARLIMKYNTKCWDRKLSKIPKYPKKFKHVIRGHLGHLTGQAAEWLKSKGKKIGNWFKDKHRKVKKWLGGLFDADIGYNDYYNMYYYDDMESEYDDLYNELFDELYYDEYDDDKYNGYYDYLYYYIPSKWWPQGHVVEKKK